MFSIQTATNQFLSGLSGIEKRLTNDNRQVSSGLRVQTVSDAPDSISQILQVNAQVSASNQVKANLTAVQLEVNVAEGAVNSATTLMDRAAQLAADGASDATSVDRPQLAAQVQNILVEMQQLTSTQVSGRYVFSGGTDQTPPYGAVDLITNTTNGVGTYTGNSHVKTIGDSYGSQFQISLTAQDVFDGGPSGTSSDSVFQSLTQLYNALAASDQAATAAAAANIRTSANYLGQQQAIYGDFQQRISDALVSQGALDTNLHAELSNLQDADMARAITQQQTDTTALTAAQVAYSSFPKKSLFDYIG
ncbi:MAG TPA: flagellin [Bryobacteraceae bacterium]|nr:flagellin [Bryobacteraceae bacterium]